jgi:hypothetical protein
MNQYNRLGWVTSLSVTQSTQLIDATAYGDQNRRVIPAGISQVEFQLSGIASCTPGVMRTLQSWIDDGLNYPTFQKEFRCLYCTSPNLIQRTHCSQCGAPRSFVIG